jgi:hypothetical protein
MFLNKGWFYPVAHLAKSGDILVVMTEGLTGTQREEARDTLKPCNAQQRIIWPKTSMVLKSRKSD